MRDNSKAELGSVKTVNAELQVTNEPYEKALALFEIKL